MIRIVPLALAVLLASGCDRPDPASRVADAKRDPAFGNAAAAHSVMQPRVIAETAPAPTPTPTPPPPPRSATLLFPEGATLDDTAIAAIDALLAAPGLPVDARWTLRGSSDSQGPDEANLTVSRRRAMAVQAYLIDRGVDGDRITVVALGDGRPVAPNVQLDGSDDPAGRARNRRVDIEIMPPVPASAPADAATPVAR